MHKPIDMCALAGSYVQIYCISNLLLLKTPRLCKRPPKLDLHPFFHSIIHQEGQTYQYLPPIPLTIIDYIQIPRFTLEALLLLKLNKK